MKRKAFSPIIILLVVGLCLVVGGGIIYSRAHQLASYRSSGIPTSTTTPVTDQSSTIIQATTTIVVSTSSPPNPMQSTNTRTVSASPKHNLQPSSQLTSSDYPVTWQEATVSYEVVRTSLQPPGIPECNPNVPFCGNEPTLVDLYLSATNNGKTDYSSGSIPLQLSQLDGNGKLVAPDAITIQNSTGILKSGATSSIDVKFDVAGRINMAEFTTGGSSNIFFDVTPQTASGVVREGCVFTASPSAMVIGGTSQLQWRCMNASRCAITTDQGDSLPISNAPTGTINVVPKNTTNYNLSCSGADDTSYSSTTSVETVLGLPEVSCGQSVCPVEAADADTITRYWEAYRTRWDGHYEAIATTTPNGAAAMFISDEKGKMVTSVHPGTFMSWSPNDLIALVSVPAEGGNKVYYLSVTTDQSVDSGLPHNIQSAALEPVDNFPAYAFPMSLHIVMGVDRVLNNQHDNWVSFSPDGSSVAFVREDATSSSLWIDDEEFSVLHNIAKVDPHYPPIWSAEGSRIIYIYNGYVWQYGL